MAGLIVNLLFGIGRFLGFLSSAFFILFFIGEGIPSIVNGKIEMNFLFFVIFLFISIFGYVLSYFKNISGGIIQIIGGLSMFVFHLAAGGAKDIDTAFLFGFPFIFCGLATIIFNKFTKTK